MTCRCVAQARVLMIIGLPQSVIIEVSRACRAIMPAGADLGRVLRADRRERPPFDPSHPLGCHRRRIRDRVVFEHVVQALVHSSGYERIATPGCSDRTIRRRLKVWAAAGIGERVHALALRAYDQMIGLELGDVAVDGCLTKAPCGGERAGPSPVDRRKGGLKRSVATENYGIPLDRLGRRQPARLAAAGPHADRRRTPARRRPAQRPHLPPGRRLRQPACPPDPR